MSPPFAGLFPQIIAEKKSLVRYANLQGTLAMMQASPGGKIDYPGLITWGLLTKEESVLLQRTKLPSKYIVVVQWMSSLIHSLAERRNMPQRTITLFLKDLGAMRGASASLLTLVNHQIPYTYVHLMALIVKVRGASARFSRV